jgi:hypothetical protein
MASTDSRADKELPPGDRPAEPVTGTGGASG